MPVDVYDHTLGVLREAVDRARLGNDDKLSALRRLDDAARRLEASAEAPDFDAFVERERRRSPELGGRTVLGPAGGRKRREPQGQLVLPGCE